MISANETMANESKDFDEVKQKNSESSQIESNIVAKPPMQEERVYAPPPIVSSGLKCQTHAGNLIHSYLVEKVVSSKLKSYQYTVLCS